LLSDNGVVETLRAEPGAAAVEAVLAGTRRVSRQWSGLRVEYAWLPPFLGAALTKPNRVEVVFSAHDDVLMDQEARTYQITAPPGGMFVVGEHPTTLRRVGAYSDTLEMYPDLALLRAAARQRGIEAFQLEPTLGRQRSLVFTRDPVTLGIAHRLRRVCMNQQTISDLEASTLAHVLARRLIASQHGEQRGSRAPSQLGRRRLERVAEYIEAGLGGRLTLEELARVAALSPFHFARCFKATTGLAPHQFVAARRIELAKRLIMTTRQPIEEVAWTVGFENVSHFRRQFAAQVGVVPGLLRRVTRGHQRALASPSR
jgi:AraC family transcriptional regulator